VFYVDKYIDSVDKLRKDGYLTEVVLKLEITGSERLNNKAILELLFIIYSNNVNSLPIPNKGSLQNSLLKLDRE
jgi:hypothetical protein